MDALVRVLTVVFWTTTALAAAWLALNAWNGAGVEGVLGGATSSLVYTVLLRLLALCSGGILWREWRENPLEESEYGEWTMAQLFYAIVFAITFFIGFISFVNWYFSL